MPSRLMVGRLPLEENILGPNPSSATILGSYLRFPREYPGFFTSWCQSPSPATILDKESKKISTAKFVSFNNIFCERIC